MAKRIVTFGECDSPDEVCKLMQEVFDTMESMNAKNDEYNAAVDKYNGTVPKKRKGSVRVSVLAIICFVALFASTVCGYVTSDINWDVVSNPDTLLTYLEDVLKNPTSDTYLFTPQTSAPTGTVVVEGLVYYDDTAKTLKLHNGTSFVPIDTAGGVSLDSAYNFGSAGGGRAIGATDGAVTITKDDGGTENVLEISASPSGSADGDGILITSGSNSTGVGLQFANSGSGNDVAGTSDTWTISAAGAFVGVGGTWTGDHLFTGNAANIEVDVSQDAIHFLDSAILAIGGATTAAGDFTFAYDATDLNMEAAAANDDFRMGETTHFDFSIHGETNTNVVKFDTDDSALVCIFDGFTLRINDDDDLVFGDSSEFTVEYDEDSTDNLLVVALNANDAVQFGDGSSSSTDVKMMAGTDGDFALWDSSADEMFFEDADLKINEGAQIEFSVADNSVDWTIDVSTDEVLLFLPAETTDDQSFNVGNATNTADVRIFGATASTVVFDASGDKVTFNAYDMLFGDGDILEFGDSADINVAYDGSGNDLNILGNGLEVSFGVTDEGMDVVFWGATASQRAWWDESGDEWFFGDDAEGVDVTFNANTTGDLFLWDESEEALAGTGVDIRLDSDSELHDAVNAGTKVVFGTPITIVFRPDAAATLTYTVPAGFDLVVTDCTAWKTAGAGANAADQWDLQNNDGTAANIFDTEELNSIGDKARIDFDNLDDAENEIEAADTLDLVAGENAANGTDGIITVSGYLKTAD